MYSECYMYMYCGGGGMYMTVTAVPGGGAQYYYGSATWTTIASCIATWKLQTKSVARRGPHPRDPPGLKMRAGR